jgi:three-Cys-motif partner protein
MSAHAIKAENKMLEPEAIGIWTEIKLQIIREYASAYTTILKEKPWCRSYAYIDAFAGPGEFISKEDRKRTIPGSPVNALDIQNKFTEYHFIDIDRSKIEQLQKLVVGKPEFKTVRFHIGDANPILRETILPHFQYGSFKRALCILDPYGVDIEWTTIESIGKAKTIDVFLNFPLMDINRNAALKTLEAANPEEGARLTKIWGDESWKTLAYVQQDQLFSPPVLIKKGDGNETLKRGFGERLKKVAGFEFVPEPILMTNMQAGPLYFLFFASHQPVAQGIAEDILRKWGGG